MVILSLRLFTALFLCVWAFSTSASLLVSDVNGLQFEEYDSTTGVHIRTWDTLGALHYGMDQGSDGLVYSADFYSGVIKRYDPTTGAYLDDFSASGLISQATHTIFGTDGDLFVSTYGGQVHRFDGTTGAYEGQFATGGSRGRDLNFGPDGHLYVVSETSPGAIRRYDGSTGTYLGDFTSGINMTYPHGIDWGPDGHLYVGDFSSNRVLRFNGTTGVYMDTFANVSGATFLSFGPDDDLFVTQVYADSVLRLDGATGASEGTFASGNITVPAGLLFLNSSSGSVPVPGALMLMLGLLPLIRSFHKTGTGE